MIQPDERLLSFLAYAEERGRDAYAHFHVLSSPCLAEGEERIADAVKAEAGGYAHDNAAELGSVVLPADYAERHAERHQKQREFEPCHLAEQPHGIGILADERGKQEVVEAHVGSCLHEIAV